MKKSVLFIINPNSGHKRGEGIVELIPRYIDLSKFAYTCKLTSHAKHATELAKQAVADGTDIVVAVGGDGLVNEVFQSLVNTDTALSIIPIGSGNGIARSIGIDMKIKNTFKQLNEGKLTKIDTVLFNKLPYLGVAGIGFDGLIAWEFSRSQKRGIMSYVKLILKKLASFKSSHYVVTDGKRNWDFDAFIVSIANAQQYGNGAFIAPEAKLDSGQLDLVVVKKQFKWLLPLLAFRVMTKSINKSRYVEIIRAPKFKITTNYNQAHVDGEPIVPKNVNNVEILPLSLNIFS